MVLEDGRGPALSHAALDHSLDRICLTRTRGDEDVGARVHDRAQALGHAVRGNLVDVAIEEAGVVAAGLLGQDAHMGARREGAAGLVEADVAVRADAEDLDVDATVGLDGLVVGGSAGLEVIAPAVGAVCRTLGHVDEVDEVAVDEVRVALVVVAGQAHVLVEVVGANLGKGDLTGLVAAHELRVELQRRGTRGQAEHKVRLSTVDLEDAVCCEGCDLIFVVENSNSHVFNLTLLTSICQTNQG